ncbi:hypothetical protein [Haloglomus halophilum]|jgi:hypothetical protein|uniref:hypothetical protein n=1 Tax=Haloglomus halophilum TaxID=2962672 RepID=UPI0020CA1E80|nr:hypothetical protein [Haloglomus halophilum]
MDTDWWYRRVVLPAGGLGLLLGLASLLLTGTYRGPADGGLLALVGYGTYAPLVDWLGLAGFATLLLAAGFRARYVAAGDGDRADG